MRTRLSSILIWPVVCFAAANPSSAQESHPTVLSNRGYTKVINDIKRKASSIGNKLNKQTRKYLSTMQKQEARLRRRLVQKDSMTIHLFDRIEGDYKNLTELTPTASMHSLFYSGHLDSITTSLRFLMSDGLQTGVSAPQMQKAIDECMWLQEQLNAANHLQKYFRQRNIALKEQFQKLGMLKQLKSFQKHVYYYKAQVAEYKKMFEGGSRMEAKLMQILSGTALFKDFFSKNSMLARIFPNIGAANVSMSSSRVIGLQSRTAISQFLNTRFAGTANVSRSLHRDIQSAQTQIDQLRNKLSSLNCTTCGNGDDLDMPNFRPDNQKAKSLFQRLEYGTNLQTVRGNGHFPITTDLGFSVGLRLSDKNIIGIGASYKIGWGKTINHINVTSEGAGLRSFLDLNLRKNFFVSGGFEYNYQKPFHSLTIVNDLSGWQQSALIGLSKIISLNTKVFKKTKIQLLWDFLSYQQLPQTQPLKFRIGYSF